MAIPLHKPSVVFNMIGGKMLQTSPPLEAFSIYRLIHALDRIPLHSYIDWRTGRFDDSEAQRVGWIMLNIFFQDGFFRDMDVSTPIEDFERRMSEVWSDAYDHRADYLMFLAALRSMPPHIGRSFVLAAKVVIADHFNSKRFPYMNSLISMVGGGE